MKINWGTGIVLAFVFFISFILFFVIKVSVSKKYNHELVTEGYYQKELIYQENINKANKAKEKGLQLTVNKTNEGLLITFPESLTPENIKGKVFLYRPSNEQLDFETTISLVSSHNLLIPNTRLLDGRWNISIDWEYNNENYFFQKKLTY